MKYALVSDIHANLEAFTEVLKKIKEEECEKIVCLGDIVGYGANPRECIALVREHNMATIAGNHDFACIGKTNINYFNSYAKEATLWTRKITTDEDKKFLNNLPLVDYHENFTVVHGTLYSPELFDYIQTTYDAYLSLQLLESQICFLGHSHVPITFFQGDLISYTLNPVVKIEEGVKALINIGSVGQPRDDNPRASFATYDTDKMEVEIHRVEYDVEKTMAKILKAGLPPPLAERLKYGR
ncbi:MAG: metallophosphoesterase family protein [Planctomycetota bacterium]|nr:metallophosphoesterase family protein [Planctomycetota bacterium]